MIMNTYSKESIETFICEYFHITQEELHTGQTINCPSLRLNGDIRQRRRKIIKANAFVSSNTSIRTAFWLIRSVALPCYKGLYLIERIFDVGIIKYAKEKCLECALDDICQRMSKSVFWCRSTN